LTPLQVAVQICYGSIGKRGATGFFHIKLTSTPRGGDHGNATNLMRALLNFQDKRDLLS
jgi:hypothetical protein